jgi:hypothetical protein
LVGAVLFDFQTYPAIGSNPTYPVIIFTSDHGDYGGSHWMHTKGGGLYDEAYNVPLLIQQRNQTAQIITNFVCSGVDMLPFIYSAALGNESWRQSSADIVNYLQGRESILDVIHMSGSASQRRTVTVPNGAGGLVTVPYVLFSTDEYNVAPGAPSHAIGFRTVDNSYANTFSNGTGTYFGGAKLGMYTYWNPGQTYPNTASNALTQFEFYDYYAGSDNYPELGNQAFHLGNWNAATAGMYLNAYNNIMAAELYNIYPQILLGYNAGLEAYLTFQATWEGNYQTYPPNKIPPP